MGGFTYKEMGPKERTGTKYFGNREAQEQQQFISEDSACHQQTEYAVLVCGAGHWENMRNPLYVCRKAQDVRGHRTRHDSGAMAACSQHPHTLPWELG